MSAFRQGSGDVFGPNGAVADHIPQFSGATGKILKDGKAAPAGEIVGTTDTQTLTNKTFQEAAATYRASGVVYINSTLVNNVTTTDTSFYKYTAPAGLLAKNGDTFRVTSLIVGQSSANKTPRFKLNGTTIYEFASTTVSVRWLWHVLITRTAASAQKIMVNLTWFNAAAITTGAFVEEVYVGALNTANPIDIEMTGLGSVTGQFWGEQMIVEFLPAP